MRAVSDCFFSELCVPPGGLRQDSHISCREWSRSDNFDIYVNQLSDKAMHPLGTSGPKNQSFD